MQPTDVQVARTLAALEDGIALHQGAVVSGRIPRDTLELMLGELPEGLMAGLEEDDSVRPDRLAEARARIAQGDEPSSDELADRIVGRLVCDRLR